jgi:lysozyme
MIDALLTHLADEEGLRFYVYDDATGEPIVPGYTVVGHPTIWHGLCVEKGRVPKLWDSLPRDALAFVAKAKFAELVARIPWALELPWRTQLGLAAMAYQLGVDGVLEFKNMLAALKAGDLVAAKAHALDSDWARNDTPVRAKRVAAFIANEAL